MKNQEGSKNRLILDHLNSGRALTGKDAWALYGVYRLSSVINRLRNEGYDIKTTMITAMGGCDFGSYSLQGSEKIMTKKFK